MSIVESAYKKTFEKADSGAPLSYPCTANRLKIDGFVVMGQEPCCISTIKHEGDLVHVISYHIFTGKKYSATFMSTDCCEVPVIERKDYQLVDIDQDGYLSLYHEGVPKQDLRLGPNRLDTKLRIAFECGKLLVVTVQRSMGVEGVFSFKEEGAS